MQVDLLQQSFACRFIHVQGFSLVASESFHRFIGIVGMFRNLARNASTSIVTGGPLLRVWRTGMYHLLVLHGGQCGDVIRQSHLRAYFEIRAMVEDEYGSCSIAVTYGISFSASSFMIRLAIGDSRACHARDCCKRAFDGLIAVSVEESMKALIGS